MTKAPAQPATSDQSHPAVKPNSADMAPSDLKEQFKKLLVQRITSFFTFSSANCRYLCFYSER